MAHPITPPTATSIISLRSNNISHSPSLAFHRVQASAPPLDVHRRTITLGLAGAILGLKAGDNQIASAAARRPPPPPAEEKKDPNVSGVIAKVLASKKRKEAMKEAMGKLREKGKPIKEPSE